MTILIPCPQCGRELKLPDRKFLGRKGQCPKCGHTFVLLEAGELPIAPVKSGAEKNDPSPAKSSSRANERPPTEAEPSVQQQTVEPAAEKSESTNVPVETNSPMEVATSSLEFASFEHVAGSTGPAARLKALQRRNIHGRNVGIIVVAVLACVAIAIALFGPRPVSKFPPPKTDQEIDQAKSPEVDEIDEASRSGRDGLDPTRTEYAKMGSPTQGKQIDLQYIPFGTQVIVNLHPAEMWRDQGLGQLRDCVPPLANLIESTIKELFQCPPDAVRELLICLIPGARGTPPNVAAVAHLVESQEATQFIERLGLRKDADRKSVYVAGRRAYLIADLTTLAVCPLDQVDEMLQAVENRHPVEQIDPLLSMTDRDRHLTVIFTPLTVALHDAWFAESVRPLVKSSLDWLGDEIEAVEWSCHLTEELFHSEIVLRNKQTPARSMPRNIRQKVVQLAGHLVPLFQLMNPQEQGKRMVIGRVPAMVEVFSMATIFQQGRRHVQLTTPLPHRAAANIFLGTFLAWDEATRTDFTKAKPVSTEGPPIPVTVAARLEMTIDVDFRSAPFSEAFSFISGEIKTPIELDGDAIKAGGFTKNLKQTFQMDAVSVKNVIARIFLESKGVDSNPEKRLVVVVDETGKKLLITTLAAADKKGLKATTLE